MTCGGERAPYRMRYQKKPAGKHIMQPLLDHEDFIKSRKSLLASSSLLLLLQHVSSSDDVETITFMSLQIKQSALIGFSSLSVCYFAWVFLLRSVEQVITFTEDLEEKYAPKLSARRAAYVSAMRAHREISAEKKYDPDKTAKRRAASLKQLHRANVLGRRYNIKFAVHLALRGVVLFLVDLLPPLFFALWVLNQADALESVGVFLSPTKT